MNKRQSAKRVLISQMPCEGSSTRSIAGTADVSINTIAKLLVDAAFHDEDTRNVKAQRAHCDGIWSFTHAKQKYVASAKAAPEEVDDTWTCTALDAELKLIVWWLVGGRDAEYANAFMNDLASRLATRVQLTTDGHRAYLEAVEGAFGADVDYAQLVKLYGEAPEAQRRYSPAECIGARKEAITGRPDRKHVSASYVERQNLTMRMHMRRFTRLTNEFSKKFESHVHMVALYTVWYNFVRIHKTLKVTPAMAAGLSPILWSMEDVAGLIDAAAPKPGKRGSYKKRAA